MWYWPASNVSLAIPVAFWNALCINWLLELIHRLLVASVLCQSWQSGGCSVKSATPALAADWGQKLEGPVSLLLHKMYITYCSMNLKSLKEWMDCCFELWSCPPFWPHFQSVCEAPTFLFCHAAEGSLLCCCSDLTSAHTSTLYWTVHMVVHAILKIQRHLFSFKD